MELLDEMDTVTKARPFAVALFGFTDREHRAISSALKLSEARSKSYLLWDSGSSPPDICMVNEDLPAGAEAWRHLHSHFPNASIPTIRLGAIDRPSAHFEDTHAVFLKRPVLANRVLRALDGLVTTAFHYAPELAIHDDMPTDTLPHRRPGAGDRPSYSALGRILVVDDSESVRRMMEVQLTQQGYTVDFAMSGEDGLAKASQRSYVLIFLDVMLPGINGYDVARLLKRNRAHQPPVVMLTSKSSRIDKLRGALASADAYLTKPVSIDTLRATLERFAPRQGPETQLDSRLAPC